MLCSGCAKMDIILHASLIINKLSSKNYFPMQEIVQIRILLQINNITKRLFQDCPRFVPEILRGTKNIRGAGGTGDKI